MKQIFDSDFQLMDVLILPYPYGVFDYTTHPPTLLWQPPHGLMVDPRHHPDSAPAPEVIITGCAHHEVL